MSLLLNNLFIVSTAFASGTSNIQEVGVVACTVHHGTLKPECNDNQEPLNCFDENAKSEVLNRYIVAEKMCLDDPELCQGKVYDSFSERRRLTKARLSVSFDEKVAVSIRTAGISIKSQSDTQKLSASGQNAAGLAGKEESVELYTKTKEASYLTSCRGFVASKEEIAAHTPKQLKEKLTQLFLEQ